MACTAQEQTWLTEAKAALHKLTTGTQVVSVDVDGQRVTYTQASRNDLARYVRDLEAKCGDTPTTSRRRPIRFAG